MRIAPTMTAFKANSKPVYRINIPNRTIECFNSTNEAAKACGYSISVVQECIKNDRQYGESKDKDIFMRGLNIEVDNQGNLIYDKEEITQAVREKIEKIREKQKIAQGNRNGGSVKKPVILMNIETRKTTRFQSQSEASKSLGIDGTILSHQLTKEGYCIINKESILIPLENVVNENKDLDKSKYGKYLNILKENGYKPPRAVKTVIDKYADKETIDPNNEGVYVVDKNSSIRKFKSIDFAALFLNAEMTDLYNCIETENYQCRGFVIIPARFVEKTSEEGNILDKKLLAKIASVSKQFAKEEFEQA